MLNVDLGNTRIWNTRIWTETSVQTTSKRQQKIAQVKKGSGRCTLERTYTSPVQNIKSGYRVSRMHLYLHHSTREVSWNAYPLTYSS